MVKRSNETIYLNGSDQNREKLGRMIGRPVDKIDPDKIHYVPYIRLGKEEEKRYDEEKDEFLEIK